MLVTTPIFYVNAEPHIGHIYSAVMADSFARWNRLLGHEVHLVTGTDEHGNKVRDAAERQGMRPPAFCSEISSRFRAALIAADVAFDDFVRTSSERHQRAVAALWTRLRRSGHIVLGEHTGWYCRANEEFVPNGHVTDAPGGGKVLRGTTHCLEYVAEPNYMFRLSPFADHLKQLVASDRLEVSPGRCKSEVLAMLGQEQNLSISRLSSSASWGIPVPDDPSHTVYVWLDALTNYLTACGYPSCSPDSLWPAEAHIIGKDILRFHAVYWPSFLLAGGLPLPKKIVAHSHWTVNGVKMSKSLGNVVSPQLMTARLGSADAMRYYLLRVGGLAHDADLCMNRAGDTVTSDLADRLGNLYSRALALLDDTVLPRPPPPPPRFPDAVADAFDGLRFDLGLQAISDGIRLANQEFTQRQPWAVRRYDGDAAGDAVVAALDAVRVAGILLQPVVPRLAAKLLDHMQVPDTHRSFAHASNYTPVRPRTRDFVLFERVKAAPTQQTPAKVG